jgi:hypothetical protein
MRGWKAYRLSLGVVAIGACAALGCAKAVRPAKTAVSGEPYRLESEGQFPPLDTARVRGEVDRIDVFEESMVVEDTVAVENVVEEVPAPVDSSLDSTTAPGYRVQVLATGNREQADAFRADVEARLALPAYVEDVDGVYKVRVGDCRLRAEAEDLLRRCRAAGYDDAWIVAGEVRWRRMEP